MVSDIDKKNDEVDLFELFKRIGNAIAGWIIALLKAILSSIVFLFRKWLPLGLSLIVAVGLTFLAKKTITPVFESELTIRSNTVPTADMISYINKLHSYAITNNTHPLAESLTLTGEIAARVRDIEAFWVIDMNADRIPDYVDYENNFNVYDSINVRMDRRIAVRVRLTDVSLFNEIRNGLFSYLNSNKLFSEMNEMRLSQMQELISRFEYDIDQLDSLQKIKYFEETKNRSPERNGQMIFLQEQRTQLIYEDIYSLYNRKQELDQETDLYKEIITLISDFTVPSKPYTGMVYYGKIIIPAVLILTLLLLLVIEFRVRVINYLSKS